RAAGRLWVRVGVERGFLDGRPRSPRPPAGADAFVGIRFLGHVIGTVRDTARMHGRPPAGEAGARQVEASPPEVRRAALADEAAAELLEHAIRLRENAPASVGGLGLVG